MDPARDLIDPQGAPMTATAKQLPHLMTVEEFLAWDGGGHVGKLELVDGLPRAMSPASATHALIQNSISTAITNHLRSRKSPCRTGTEAPIVPPMGQRINARAPDVSVTCSPPASNGTFVDPILIVEVMSPSNEADTWESIRSLAGLTSLREILVVQSTSVEAHVYRRDAQGAWPSEPVVAKAGGTIRLESIDLDLALSEIYRDTPLAE
jgi:Uma2 family endonuclease